LIDTLERPSNSQELVGVDLEVAVLNVEPGWRPSSLSPGLFRSVDTGLNPTGPLFVLYTHKVGLPTAATKRASTPHLPLLFAAIER